MKKIICFTLIALFPFFLQAQSFKKLIKKGNKHHRKGEINRALEYYLEAEKMEPGNVKLNLFLGKAYLQSDSKHYALPYITKVQKLSPNEDPDIFYYMGLACQYNYLFEDGIKYFSAYGSQSKQNELRVKNRIIQCRNADSLLQFPVAVEIENLGAAVNSPAHDYAPVITPDETILVFTSRREGSTGGLKTKDNEFFEDIYICRQTNKGWSAPTKISKNINFKFHDAAAAISPDGRELYIYMEEGGGDIYHSTYDGKDWSTPQPLPYPINTDYWETSVSVSPDGRKLYFSSDRPGGSGGLDIYSCDLQANGQWGKPVNLGNIINSSLNDDSPYIHSDNKTLYFCSDGHPGIGGYDVFISDWKNDAWQLPVNMGYPVNTPDDNFHFTMAADKNTGYYTSVQEGGIGKADLYKVKFLDEKVKQIQEAARKKKAEEALLAEQQRAQKEREMAVVIYEGTIIDAESGNPIPGTVTISHHLSGQLIAEAIAGQDGGFELIVPKEGDYGLSVESKGYLIQSRKLRIQKKENQQKVSVNLRMYPLQVGSTTIMANIFFDTGKSSLRTESIAELEKIKKFLENAPTLKLQINGHTDNVGNATFNKILSRKRAQSVKTYLTQNGIEESRLTVMGYGQERPIVSNDDEEEGRALNRRTEIEVISF